MVSLISIVTHPGNIGGGCILFSYIVELKSTFESVDTTVRNMMDIISNQWGIQSSNKIFSLNLVLRELLNNAVEHGNRMVEEKKVVCKIVYCSKEVCIEVTDEGEGFSPSELKKYDTNDYADIFRERGRGLLIMRGMGFDVSVNKNHVTAKMNI